jgi:hypothetical protein
MKTLNDLTLGVYAANVKGLAKPIEHNFVAVKIKISII